MWWVNIHSPSTTSVSNVSKSRMWTSSILPGSGDSKEIVRIPWGMVSNSKASSMSWTSGCLQFTLQVSYIVTPGHYSFNTLLQCCRSAGNGTTNWILIQCHQLMYGLTIDSDRNDGSAVFCLEDIRVDTKPNLKCNRCFLLNRFDR